MAETLRAENLSLVYGNAATALENVSIEVPPGSVVAILGANGAGKTSLVRALTSQHRYYGARLSGAVTMGGDNLAGRDPAALLRAGIVQVPEGRKLFANLTVSENLETGAMAEKGVSRADVRNRFAEVLDIFPKLKAMLETQAGLLSGGEQQMVAICRALMARPRVLLCDELSLGLAPLAIKGIYDTLAELNRTTGLSLVVIEQNARQALMMATYAYVLEVGRVASQGPAAELRASAGIERFYLGGH